MAQQDWHVRARHDALHVRLPLLPVSRSPWRRPVNDTGPDGHLLRERVGGAARRHAQRHSALYVRTYARSLAERVRSH